MYYRTILLLLCCSMGLPASVQQPQTPAETGIAKAEAQIARRPDYYPYYNALAMAYARRARESSDVQYYAKAEETLKRSFAIAPDNFEGLKVETWLLLGRHEFAKARELAVALNKKMPDDVTVYGYLVDSNVELGNYGDAVKAAQWMLNLRPGNIAGLTRAAYLRELHGQIPGAIRAMQAAYDATPYQEFEDRAWVLTQIAHLHLVAGDLDKAEMFANGALGLFPGYHYALGALAQVRVAEKRYAEAVDLLERRYAEAPHAENLYELAHALDLAGRHEEAAAAYAGFEKKAVAESALADNANRELILYYTDIAHRPADALRLAEREIERRHDVFTIDCYAWALAANGEYSRAAAEIEKAVSLGCKSPVILEHARQITMKVSTPKA